MARIYGRPWWAEETAAVEPTHSENVVASRPLVFSINRELGLPDNKQYYIYLSLGLAFLCVGR
jgi:hypothetical protein